MDSQYIPGVCNIGPAEIKLRKQVGWVGLAVAFGFLVLLVLVGAARGWRLFLFFPVMLSANGYFQARFHFCTGFGMKGVFNFTPEAGKTETVQQAEFRALDKKKALKIISYSVAVGIVVALLAYVI